MTRVSTAVLSLSAVAYLWVSSYTTGLFGLTPSALLAGLAIYLAVLRFLGGRKNAFDPEFVNLLAISLGLLVWAAFVYAVFGLGIPRRAAQIALGIAVGFSVYMIADSYAGVKLLVGTAVAGAALSALVGVGHFFFGEPFVSLWLASGKVTEGAVRNVLSGRIAGLAPNPVSLSYHLAAVVPLGVALWWGLQRKGSKLVRVGLAGAISAMIVAVILTGVRSAVGGTLLGTAHTVFLLRSRAGRWWRPLIAGMIASAAAYWLVGWLYNPVRFLAMEDVSAKARLPMQLTAVAYALKHPFGTSTYELDEEYLDLLAIDDPQIAEEVLKHTTHNQFLNVLVFYGFPGLSLLAVFYWIVLKKTYALQRRVTRSDLANLSWLPAGIAGSLLGYLVNSMFHNAGPFVGDIFHWYIIGLVFSAHRVVGQQPHSRTFEGIP